MILYQKLQQGDSIDLPQVEIQGYNPYEYTEQQAREAITGEASGGVKPRPMPPTKGYYTSDSDNWDPEYRNARFAHMNYRDSIANYNSGIESAEWEAQEEYKRRIAAGEVSSPEMIDELYNKWLEPVISQTPTESDWGGINSVKYGYNADEGSYRRQYNQKPLGVVEENEWVTDTLDNYYYNQDGLDIERYRVEQRLPSASYYRKPTWPHGEPEVQALQQRESATITPVHSRSGIGLNNELDTNIQAGEATPAVQTDPMRWRRHTRNVEGQGIPVYEGSQTMKRRQSGYMAMDPYGDETFFTPQEYHDLNITYPNYGGNNMYQR